MSRVVHFEISADQPERAVQFYSSVFGWKINKWSNENYWLATTGDESEPGIDGAIQTRSDPNATTVNTIDVESVEDSVARIQDCGGTILQPKTVIPGIGYWALCKD